MWQQILISLNQIRWLSPTLDGTCGSFPSRVTQCESRFGRAVYCSDSKSSVEEDGEVDLSNHLGFREITTPLLALCGLFYYLLFIICWRNEAGTHTEMAAVRYISLLISKIIPKTAAPADKQARADNWGAR